jgi:hypothetical protein
MNRAAVLIGVRKAHDLPELQAVYQGVDGMEEWALSQGIPRERIRRITDETGRVTPQMIKDIVEELLKKGDVEQLIVYFAGHGVNIGYGEYWLLTEAILDSDAAVNVKSSEERARSGTVPHVVFFSDACRTAAEGIQAQGLTGSSIFLNRPGSGPTKSVDLFFATQLGDPALEIRDPKEAARVFSAVYTDALLEALRGQWPDIAEPDTAVGGHVIRPWPLQEFLEDELPKRVYQATAGPNPRSQLPDARISSRPSKTWLSRVPHVSSEHRAPKFSPPPPDDALKHAKYANQAAKRMNLATRAMLKPETGLESSLDLIPMTESISRSELDIFSKQNRQFRDNARSMALPFGPLHMETHCGFKVRGTTIAACRSQVKSGVFADGTGAHAAVENHSAAPCLLEFGNGTGVLLPAIGGFLASLTFENGLLVDVAYEPSEFTERWNLFEARAAEIRSLRAAIAAATRSGVFRLLGDDAQQLAQRMQFAKGIDPTLALYAAHAYRDQGNRKRFQEMVRYLQADLGFCPFDIALLDGQLDDNTDDPRRQHILPQLPMLSQSWPLLPAYDVRLADGLNGIGRHLVPNSLWTLLTADGVRLVAATLEKAPSQ